MTIDEAIRVVSIVALADHPAITNSKYPDNNFQPLALEEVIASAEVQGRAGELEARYFDHPLNWVIDVTYADRGWKARYEVGPTTPEPICWAD